jgi:hypothetical protein
MKSSIFWDITLCSPLKAKWCFGGTCHLHLEGWRINQARSELCCFMLVSYLAYSSTSKMAATCSSEMLLEFQRTTKCHIPEHRTLHSLGCNNLKSYVIYLMLLPVAQTAQCWALGQLIHWTDWSVHVNGGVWEAILWPLVSRTCRSHTV